MGARGIEEADLPSALSPTDPATSVFLVSASYEPRSLTVAAGLPTNCRFRLGLVYANAEFLEGPAAAATQGNLDRLQEYLGDRCDAVMPVVGSWLDPTKQLEVLRFLVTETARQVTEVRAINVWVDTTTFTRESLVVGCALFRRHFTGGRFRLLYTAPEKHGEWLSRGYRGVRNMMGFPGCQVPGAPMILVVLSGFEPERTMRAIEEHEPSRVLLGIGNPPTTGAFLERNLREQELVLARQDVERFEFPVDSVAECVRELTSVVGPELLRGNVVIAPMSTKLSTVAAMIVAENHPSIQLTYCVPGEYNTESYSVGASRVFVEDL